MFDINNLQIHSNVTSKELEQAINKIKSDNKLKGLGSSFITAQNKYNVNAIILASIACLESGYGTSKLAKEKNNLFGMDAPLSAVNTTKYGKSFTSKSICIDVAGHRLGKQYLELDNDASWRYCNGKKDLYSVGKKWCETPDWTEKVISIANRIKNNINDMSRGGSKMKINVHAGHGADGSKSCGAIGLIKESTENRNVKNEVIRLLKQEGHAVFDCTVDYPASSGDCINQIVKKCNSNKVDLDISIHFNSGVNDKNGNGTTTGVEVLVYDNKSCYTQATRIADRISKLGYRNRGVKIRTDLGVLRSTNAPALLVECCFVDDKDDIKLYNYKTMAKSIVEGILNKSIDGDKVENKPVEVFDMDKIVLYYGDADLFGAVMVAQKHKCPLMKKNDFDNSGLKAKEIIQIGGKKEDTDRFTTFKNAAKLV